MNCYTYYTRAQSGTTGGWTGRAGEEAHFSQRNVCRPAKVDSSEGEGGGGVRVKNGGGMTAQRSPCSHIYTLLSKIPLGS